MKKTLLISLFLIAALNLNGQDIGFLWGQILKNGDSAKNYRFDLNDGNGDVTMSNYVGPFEIWSRRDFTIRYTKKPYKGLEDESKNFEILLRDVPWDLMEPIVESHPDYLPEDLVLLTLSFPIQFKIIIREDFKDNGNNYYKDGKDGYAKEFIFYVHKARAAAMKKALQAYSDGLK